MTLICKRLLRHNTKGIVYKRLSKINEGRIFVFILSVKYTIKKGKEGKPWGQQGGSLSKATDGLSLILGTPMLEGENQLQQVVPRLLHVMCMHTHKYINKQTHTV